MERTAPPAQSTLLQSLQELMSAPPSTPALLACTDTHTFTIRYTCTRTCTHTCTTHPVTHATSSHTSVTATRQYDTHHSIDCWTDKKPQLPSESQQTRASGWVTLRNGVNSVVVWSSTGMTTLGTLFGTCVCILRACVQLPSTTMRCRQGRARAAPRPLPTPLLAPLPAAPAGAAGAVDDAASWAAYSRDRNSDAGTASMLGNSRALVWSAAQGMPDQTHARSRWTVMSGRMSERL